MNKKISIGLAITLALIAMTVTFSITFVLSQQRFTVTMNSVREREQIYSKLAEIDKYVRDNYYGEIDDQKLYDMLGAGYILGIDDPNATYYTATEYAQLLDIQNGTLMGIGVEVVKDSSSGYAWVTKVYSGSPAADVGIQKGNYITQIDGTEVRGLAKETVMDLLRGEEGTTVTITYLDSESATKEVQVAHRKFDASTVEFQLLSSGYGYIRINSFNNSTPSDFDSALHQLMDQGAKGFVFDVRDNAGGILSSAVECIDILCPEGTVAQAQYKDGTVEEMGWSDENQIDLPMTVLVNEETASSAELFAAELKEFGKARLVGTTTYGKGTIQREPQQLSDGSAVSITVAALLTGNGNSFNGTGLSPDVEIALTEDKQMVYMMGPENDAQVGKAVETLNSITANSQNSQQAASSAASETAPADSAPADSAPADSAPADSVPADSAAGGE